MKIPKSNLKNIMLAFKKSGIKVTANKLKNSILLHSLFPIDNNYYLILDNELIALSGFSESDFIILVKSIYRSSYSEYITAVNLKNKKRLTIIDSSIELTRFLAYKPLGNRVINCLLSAGIPADYKNVKELILESKIQIHAGNYYCYMNKEKIKLHNFGKCSLIKILNNVSTMSLDEYMLMNK